MLRVKMPLIDDSGFVIGRLFNEPSQTVMINTTQLKRIDVNCGNNPPAHRLHFIDATPHIDILAEMEE